MSQGFRSLEQLLRSEEPTDSELSVALSTFDEALPIDLQALALARAEVEMSEAEYGCDWVTHFAGLRTLTSETYEALEGFGDASVLSALCANPAVSEALLRKIVNDGGEDAEGNNLGYVILLNPACTRELALQIALDEDCFSDSGIRYQLCKCELLTDADLNKILDCGDDTELEEILHELLSHPNISATTSKRIDSLIEQYG